MGRTVSLAVVISRCSGIHNRLLAPAPPHAAKGWLVASKTADWSVVLACTHGERIRQRNRLHGLLHSRARDAPRRTLHVSEELLDRLDAAPPSLSEFPATLSRRAFSPSSRSSPSQAAGRSAASEGLPLGPGMRKSRSSGGPAHRRARPRPTPTHLLRRGLASPSARAGASFPTSARTVGKAFSARARRGRNATRAGAMLPRRTSTPLKNSASSDSEGAPKSAARMVCCCPELTASAEAITRSPREKLLVQLISLTDIAGRRPRRLLRALDARVSANIESTAPASLRARLAREVRLFAWTAAARATGTQQRSG